MSSFIEYQLQSQNRPSCGHLSLVEAIVEDWAWEEPEVTHTTGTPGVL